MVERASVPAAEPNGDAFRHDVERVPGPIRPAVQADGGDAEFISADPADVVRVRFRGACVG